LVRVSSSDVAGLSMICATISQDGRAAFRLGRLMLNSATGCYESELDTRLLADGEARLNMTATDLAGHAVSSEALFRVDNQASSLLIVYPMEGECIGGLYGLVVEARDTYLGSVEYNVDGRGWVNISQGLDTTRLSDGGHTIIVRALDAAGHETTASVSVLVDNTDPSAQLVRPYRGEFAGGYISVKARADDTVGLRSVRLEVFRIENGTADKVDEAMMALDQSTGLFACGLDTGALPDGKYAANVTATDIAGHAVSTPAVEFNIDNHAPLVLVNSPLDGQVVSGTVAVDALVSDESGLFLELALYTTDGKTWRALGTPWNTTLSSDGPAAIVVRAADAAGHVTEASVDVIVDNSLPNVRFAGPAGPAFVEGLLEVAVEASDAAGVLSVVLTVDGLEAGIGEDAGRHVARLDTSRLADGAHALAAVVTDLAGRKRTAELEVLVDNTPPSLKVHAPRINTYVCGTVNITAAASDTYLDRTEYRVDGLDWTDIYEPLDTKLLAAGRHVLRVRSVDRIGHESASDIPFLVDNRAPQAAVISPSEDVNVAGETLVALAASDDNEVETISLRAANRSWQAALDRSTGRWEALLNTRNLPDGENDIEVEVRDISGQTSITTRRLMVDNTGPSIELRTRQALIGKSEIQFRIEDRSAIATYHYRLDGGQWKELLVEPGKGVYKFAWATELKDNGEHRLDIRAADTLGNANQAAFKLKVENPDYSWVVAVALVALALALGAVFLFRRKGRAGKAEEPEVPSIADSLPDIKPRAPPEKRTMLSETAEVEHGAGETDQAQH
jgi:hypothetical protein